MSAPTCPSCNHRLSAFIRVRTSEHVIYCPQCSMTRHVEGIGKSAELAMADLTRKTRREQKELI